MDPTHSSPRTPGDVHLVVRLSLSLETYQRLLIVRANLGTDLGELRDSFDQTSSYLLTRLLSGTMGVLVPPRGARHE